MAHWVFEFDTPALEGVVTISDRGPAPTPSPWPHLHQLLFLLGERPREFRHCLQVALGAGGFQRLQGQLFSVNLEQVGGATGRHLMELRGRRKRELRGRRERRRVEKHLRGNGDKEGRQRWSNDGLVTADVGE